MKDPTKQAADIQAGKPQPTSPDQPFRQAEQMVSSLVSASLDFYRDLRDATSEAFFFETYGNLFLLHNEDKPEAGESELPQAQNPRELPFVREALASIEEGGYPEALARVGALLARHGQAIPLSRIELEVLSVKEEEMPLLSTQELAA